MATIGMYGSLWNVSRIMVTPISTLNGMFVFAPEPAHVYWVFGIVVTSVSKSISCVHQRIGVAGVDVAFVHGLGVGVAERERPVLAADQVPVVVAGIAVGVRDHVPDPLARRTGKTGSGERVLVGGR